MFEFPILEWPMAKILSSLIVTSHVASHYERLGKKLSGNFRIPESSKYIVKTLAPTSYNNKEDYQSEAELTGRFKINMEPCRRSWCSSLELCNYNNTTYKIINV